MADPRMTQLDKHFAHARFRSLNLLDLGRDAAWVIVDQGLVPGGNLD